MTDVMVSTELFPIPEIFLERRLKDYFKAQSEKAAIRGKISSLISSLQQPLETYEGVVELEEKLLEMTLQITELRARYDILEDDFPTPGGEAPYHDGVAI